MGLDQTAYTKKINGDHVEIQYWRKHNALDGWMESLWRTKGNDGQWNCQELELLLRTSTAWRTLWRMTFCQRLTASSLAMTLALMKTKKR